MRQTTAAPPPPKEVPTKERVVAFRPDRETAEALDAYVAKYDVSLTAAVTHLVRFGLGLSVASRVPPK